MKKLNDLNRKELEQIFNLVEEMTIVLGCKDSCDFVIKCSQIDTTDFLHNEILDLHYLLVKKLSE